MIDVPAMIEGFLPLEIIILKKEPLTTEDLFTFVDLNKHY